MTSKPHRLILPILATALLLGLPLTANAHEGHQDDLSDAELVQLEMQEAAGMSDHHDGDEHGDIVADHHDAATQMQDEPAAAMPSPEEAMAMAIAQNRATSATDLLGRFHPVAAHFPIALLLTAALAELLFLLRPSTGLEVAVRFLVAGGALGAIAAALLGWVAAGWRLSDRSETLFLHRWNGTAIAGLALLATWLVFRTENRTGLRAILAALAVAMIAQGYLGGEMVFGPNHLGLR